MTKRNLLVVGARHGNLGEEIADLASDSGKFYMVRRTDFIPHDTIERLSMDITVRHDVVRVLEETEPTDVVICAGVNLPDRLDNRFGRNLNESLRVNTYGPLLLIEELMDMMVRRPHVLPKTGINVAVVSSNSAHIARSTSAGYCASKAALSMGVRCLARHYASTGLSSIWAYEPGFLDDTPMSRESSATFDKPHRIPSGHAISKALLARRIVSDLVDGGARDLNGCTFRIDGGEQ